LRRPESAEKTQKKDWKTSGGHIGQIDFHGPTVTSRYIVQETKGPNRYFHDRADAMGPERVGRKQTFGPPPDRLHERFGKVEKRTP